MLFSAELLSMLLLGVQRHSPLVICKSNSSPRPHSYHIAHAYYSCLVSNRKHCIQCEKQWDFLKELTSKIADLSAEQEEAEENYVPKRGRWVCLVTHSNAYNNGSDAEFPKRGSSVIISTHAINYNMINLIMMELRDSHRILYAKYKDIVL